MEKLSSSERLGPLGVGREDGQRRVFRWFGAASGLWFLLIGPIIAYALGLSFAAQLLVVALPAAGFGGIGVYVARPDKFRTIADHGRRSAKTR